MALALRSASMVMGRAHGPTALLAASARSVLRVGRAGTASSSEQVQQVARDEMLQYWAKNRQLGRPWSPHLQIYKPQLTSMLSLVHRATGIAMAIVWMSIGTSAFYFTGQFTELMDMVRDMHFAAPIIFTSKFVLSFPLVYHYINGMRHLAWDWSIGFGLKTVYRSGYFVSALSVLCCILLGNI